MAHPPEVLARSLASVISAHIERRGLSVRQSALSTGIPMTTLVRRLTGNSPFLSTELVAFAHLFDTTVSALVGEAEGVNAA